jgi:hypothetical protein
LKKLDNLETVTIKKDNLIINKKMNNFGFPNQFAQSQVTSTNF